MGEGAVDFNDRFEALREMDLAGKRLKPGAPKAGGGIICVRFSGFPEKMDKQAPDRIKCEFLKK